MGASVPGRRATTAQGAGVAATVGSATTCPTWAGSLLPPAVGPPQRALARVHRVEAPVRAPGHLLRRQGSRHLVLGGGPRPPGLGSLALVAGVVGQPGLAVLGQSR